MEQLYLRQTIEKREILNQLLIDENRKQLLKEYVVSFLNEHKLSEILSENFKFKNILEYFNSKEIVSKVIDNLLQTTIDSQNIKDYCVFSANNYFLYNFRFSGNSKIHSYKLFNWDLDKETLSEQSIDVFIDLFVNYISLVDTNSFTNFTKKLLLNEILENFGIETFNDFVFYVNSKGFVVIENKYDEFAVSKDNNNDLKIYRSFDTHILKLDKYGKSKETWNKLENQPFKTIESILQILNILSE